MAIDKSKVTQRDGPVNTFCNLFCDYLQATKQEEDFPAGNPSMASLWCRSMSENSVEEAPDYERQLWQQLVRDIREGKLDQPQPSEPVQWQGVSEPTQWQQVQ